MGAAAQLRHVFLSLNVLCVLNAQLQHVADGHVRYQGAIGACIDLTHIHGRTVGLGESFNSGHDWLLMVGV